MTPLWHPFPDPPAVFAQMSFALACSVLTPIASGAAGLRVDVNNPRDNPGILHLCEMTTQATESLNSGGWSFDFKFGF